MKKKSHGLVCIALGVVLLLISLVLMFYNFIQDYNSSKVSNEMLTELKSVLPQHYTNDSLNGIDYIPPKEDLFQEYVTSEYKESTITLDDNVYLGVLCIPSLGLELPILDTLDYSSLKLAPCKYSGSLNDGDLILAGHNYTSHFGKINQLNSGDVILFTDVNGVIYKFEVVQTEIINQNDVSSMSSNSSNWDLTLFTCTLSGNSRVTVRAVSLID